MKALFSILAILSGVVLPTQDRAQSLIAKEWSLLTDSTSGCLVGVQYGHNGDYRSEASCFDRNRKWKTFFAHETNVLSTFLIEQLGDTSVTQIHTCPYEVATKGELATYCLQRIYKVNWYTLDDKYAHVKGSTYEDEAGNFHSAQDDLQQELKSEAGLKLLTQKWKEILIE